MAARALLLSLAVVLGGSALPGAAEEIGDRARGEQLFAQCATCHAVGAEARHRTGPHLNRVFGRRAGSLPDFDYSPRLERMGVEGLFWTLETLDAYIENPRALVTRTRMAFPGVRDPKDRADILAYLRDFSDMPQNIPEAEPTARRTDPEVPPEILAIVGDREYGEYLSSECKTCHQASGASDGIPPITLLPVEDFVVAMHAYKTKVRPHPVMQMMAGRLTDEEIASLAAYFATLQP